MYEADDEHDTLGIFYKDDGMTRVADPAWRVWHMRFAMRDMIDAGPAAFQGLPCDQRVGGVADDIVEGREDQRLIAFLNDFAELLVTPGQDIDKLIFGGGR